VVWSALRPHGAPDRDRFSVEGPNVEVGPQCAVAFSMAVHELATNAIKYGALSAETGRVDITWSAAVDRFHWQWRERGGPPVVAPARTGFGSRMIERALALQLSGKVAIDYAPSGLVCTIEAPLAAMRDHIA
jgi:two-component sensor histidine kinase